MHDIKRPALKYFGGKWRLANWIIGMMPEHLCYAEPFGGGASVLLRKEPSAAEAYNDQDWELVNFFRTLREQPEELIRQIVLTPFSRAEQQRSVSKREDDMERARAFYANSWQTRAGNSGWAFRHKDGGVARTYWNHEETERRLLAIAKRLRTVQLDHGRASKFIERWDSPTTLFYVDPPYYGIDGYNVAMPNEAHVQLAQMLHQAEAKVIISGYHSPVYDAIYGDWRSEEMNTLQERSAARVEVCWMNY